MRNHAVAVPTLGLLTGADTVPLLVFTVEKQKYGLPITNVVRIVEMVTITPLPSAPPIIQGIINLQGKVVPVMELCRRFGLCGQTYGLHTPIILADISGDGRMLGLVVDSVEDVVHVPRTNLEIVETFVPPELAGHMAVKAAHLAGVAKIDRQMIPVLEVRALLTPTEHVKLSQALVNEVVEPKVKE